MLDNPKTPRWARKLLQGITYWIGHRRSLYDQYPLGESAFAAEFCNLIYAQLLVGGTGTGKTHLAIVRSGFRGRLYSGSIWSTGSRPRPVTDGRAGSPNI